MPAFDISTSTHTVEVDPGGTARVVFKVATQIARRVIARADVEPDDPTAMKAGWFSVEGNKWERAFDEKADELYTILVSPPADTPPGQYLFRVRMVTTSESASEFSHVSEPVAVTVKAPPAPPPPPPPPLPEIPPPPRNWWRIVAIGLAVLVVILLIAVVLLFIRQPADSPAAINCSPGRIAAAQAGEGGGALFGQVPFGVVAGEEICVDQLWISQLKTDATGTITVKYGDGQETKLRVEALLLTAFIGTTDASGIYPLDPPIGVASGNTVQVDLSACEGCSGLQTILGGARLVLASASPQPSP